MGEYFDVAELEGLVHHCVAASVLEGPRPTRSEALWLTGPTSPPDPSDGLVIPHAVVWAMFRNSN
jgi:hypothetical protein